MHSNVDISSLYLCVVTVGLFFSISMNRTKLITLDLKGSVMIARLRVMAHSYFGLQLLIGAG